MNPFFAFDSENQKTPCPFIQEQIAPSVAVDEPAAEPESALPKENYHKFPYPLLPWD